MNKNNFRVLFFIFLLAYSFIFISTANAESVQYTDKLVVIYKTSLSSNRVRVPNTPTTFGKVPFSSVLGNVIQKLTATGQILPKPFLPGTSSNIKFQEPISQIAFIESTFDKLDSYVVKVNDATVIDVLKQALEQEPGVIKVTKDFKVFLPQNIKYQSDNSGIAQTCSALPSCETGTPTCSVGTPACPDGKRRMCIFLVSKPPFPACLGGNKLTRDMYCDDGSSPLPNDPYNIENWHYEKTGLSKAWNGTCNCPPEIDSNKCNVRDHIEFCNIGDPNVIVAVLDNGFSVGAQPGTTAHPDLLGRVDLNISRNVIFGNDPFDYDSSDEPSSQVFYDHGTASTISAAGSSNNNASHAGVNWKSKLWLVRIGRGGGASFSDILAGFNYVIGKVQELNVQHFFVNLSYGSGDCNKSLAEAVNDFAGIEVKNEGGLISLASGNSACLQDFGDVAPHVIVVGATSASNSCTNEEVASYSNFGPVTDIFSPSGFVVDNRNTGVESYQLSKQTIHGTSFSAPSLAGFGTFLWSLYPSLLPEEVEKVLKVSSFNSLLLFDANTTSKDKINLSQSAQVKIDDAINLKSQILQLVITLTPDGDKQDVFALVNNQVTINATLPGSSETLNLEALNLPFGSTFQATSGSGSVSQTFSWNPGLDQINNSFQVTFLVKNSLGKVIGYQKIIFTVKEKPKNRPPISNAGADQTASEGNTVTLDGTQSFDPDGDEIKYFWSQIDNGTPQVVLSSPNAPQTTFVAPEVTKETILTFNLRVVDKSNEESIDSVNVKVQNVNKPPLINAGTDKTVRPKQVVRFSDATAVDPDGDPLTYLWTLLESPIKVIKINPTTLNTAGLYTLGTDLGLVNVKFRLTVSDGNLSSIDDVVYTVKNFPPTADAGPDRFVRRDSYVRIGSANSTDPDGDALRYSWTQVSGPSVILSGSSTQYPIFKAPSTLTTQGNQLIFRLKVDDSLGGTAIDDVAVFVVR